ncbi:hypothetical protein [Proteus mirabilis]|uniref:hypothetical protein n=1 Tax=Proteus mirabilis TaxID=584 RepID=UPI0034D6FC30
MIKIKKVATPKDIMERNIGNFITDTSERYKLFQESAPTFVTYYSKSAYGSTYDRNFESHNEAVGDESPVRFFKIEDVPVYELQVTDFSTEETETGRKGEYTTSAYLLPDTVAPNIDDMIDVRIHGKVLLLRVTGIDADNHNNKKFFKLSLKLSNMTIPDITKQVVEEQVLDFQLIGKTNNPVLRKDWKLQADLIKVTYDDLLSSIRKTFYSEAHTAFMDKKNSFIDQHLNIFILRNGLNNSFENFRDATLVSEKIQQLVPMHTYKKLVYMLLERLKVEKFPDLRVSSYLDYNSHLEFNYFHQNKIDFANYIFLNGDEINPCLTCDSNDVVIKLASMNLGPIRFPFYLFDREKYKDVKLTPNESFFVRFIEFIKEKENSDNRDKAVVELNSMIEDIEPSFININDDFYSREYYSSIFTLFALKSLHAFLTDLK